jgi:hypothetical protein
MRKMLIAWRILSSRSEVPSMANTSPAKVRSCLAFYAPAPRVFSPSMDTPFIPAIASWGALPHLPQVGCSLTPLTHSRCEPCMLERSRRVPHRELRYGSHFWRQTCQELPWQNVS